MIISLSKNKITSWVLILLLSLGGAFAVINLSSSFAHAESLNLTVSDVKKFNSGSNNNGSSVGKPTPGGGGGGNKNSGKLEPSPIPKACSVGQAKSLGKISDEKGLPGGYKWSRWASGCQNKYTEKAEFLPPPTGCPVSKEGGITREAVGMMYITRKDLLTVVTFNEMNPMATQTFYTYIESSRRGICVYPKITKTGSSKRCALDATGTLNRLANSRLGAAKLKTYKQTFTTIPQLEAGKGNCNQSPSMNFKVDLPNNANNWGQYRLSGKIGYVQCTEKITSFNGKNNRHWDCGNRKTGNAVTANGTLWCGGVVQGLVNKSWTVNDCLNRSAGSGGFTCKVPKPTFDGKTGTVQTIRDGKSRVLNWGTPKTSSNVRKTTGWEQGVTINSGSSPRNTSVGDNSKTKQYFWSNVNFGSNWIARKDKQNLAFYNASNPGGNFSMTKKLRFDGEFKTIVGDIDSYNPWTGAMKTSKRVVWLKDYNIKCDTATSPKIQVLRSVGDAQ